MDKKKIMLNYKNGFWSAAMVKMAVRKGVITQAECDEILASKKEE